MVDPQGKPYEITVIESTGNKALEKAAVEAAEDWEFEPATLNGTPIDAGHTMKVGFVLTGASGASPAFVKAYGAFNRALVSQDRARTDAAMAKLKVENLYEDAYYGLAQYQYERQWGTKAQQCAALKRAIASEERANFLPPDTFRAALTSGRIAEIKLRCAKKYVFFKYDPQVQYTIAPEYGACGMELVGDPGTQFTLTQS
jgi:TonB family protein